MKLPFRMIIIRKEKGKEGSKRERELFVNMEEGHEWSLKYRSIRLDTEWQGL